MNLIGSGLIPRGLPQGGLLKTAGVLLFVCVWSATASPKNEANGIHGVAGTLGINHTADEETALLQEVFSYMEFLKSEDTRRILQERKNHFDHELELTENRIKVLKEEYTIAYDELNKAEKLYLSKSSPDNRELIASHSKKRRIDNKLQFEDKELRRLHKQSDLIVDILQALEEGLIDDFIKELRVLEAIHTEIPLRPEELYEGYLNVLTKQARRIRRVDGVIYMHSAIGGLPSGSETDYKFLSLVIAKSRAVFELSQLSVSEYVSAFYSCSPETEIQLDPSLSNKEANRVTLLSSRYLCSKYGFEEQ